MPTTRNNVHESLFANIEIQILYFGRSVMDRESRRDVYRYPSLFNRLWYITGGDASITCNGVSGIVSKGMMCLLPINTICTIETDRLEKTWADFRLSMYTIADVFEFAHPRFIQRFGGANPAIDLYGSENILHSARIKERILVDALSFIDDEEAGAFNARAGKMLAYRDVFDHIQKHLSVSLSVNELADAGGLSGYYLSAKFKKDIGIGLKEYIDQKIVAAIKQRLHGGRRIKDIAASLGFKDFAYFSTFFKTRTGMSPKEYRVMITHPE